MFRNWGRRPTTYVQSVPGGSGRRAILRWHKVSRKDKAKTQCNFIIGPAWRRSDEPPPDGQAKCFFCFPPEQPKPEFQGRHAKGRT